MAGAPEQTYWEEPYLYVPSDPEQCNAAFDKVACSKADPDGLTFKLETINGDGTVMLIPTNWKFPAVPAPSSTQNVQGFDPSKSI